MSLCPNFMNLKNKFREQGYPMEMVEEELGRGAALQRADLLRPRPAYPVNAVPTVPAKPKFKSTFIITYNHHNPNLREWLKETHFILQSDRTTIRCLQTGPQFKE